MRFLILICWLFIAAPGYEDFGVCDLQMDFSYGHKFNNSWWREQ